MKLLYSILIILCFFVSNLSAQFRGIMDPIPTYKPKLQMLQQKNRYMGHPPIYMESHVKLPYSVRQNPGLYYLIQNLKKNKYDDIGIKAMNNLLHYTNDYGLRDVSNFIKRYTATIKDKENSINTLRLIDALDSIKYCEYNNITDPDDYVASDLSLFINYFQTDTVYQWLKHISSDSVQVCILSSMDDSLKIWINRKEETFHRFWARNERGDTIPSWIQVLPNENKVRFLIENEIPEFDPRHSLMGKIGSSIDHNIPNEYFSLHKMNPGVLKRRWWTYHTEGNVNISQGQLANWNGGGENSLSLLTNIYFYITYKKNNLSWDSWVHYRFGFLKNGDEAIRKNNDRLEMNSKLSEKAFKHWNYTLQFNVVSQIGNTYTYSDNDRTKVGNFMSPGYFTLSMGLDYKPKNTLSLVMAPIAGSWTFVRDTSSIEAKRYIGVTDKRYKRAIGASVNLNSTINKLFKVATLKNTVKLFMSYEEKDHYTGYETADERKKKIPVKLDWQMTLSFNINYFITTSIYTQIIYDEDYSRKFQFKENLNLGLSFRF